MQNISTHLSEKQAKANKHIHNLLAGTRKTIIGVKSNTARPNVNGICASAMTEGSAAMLSGHLALNMDVLRNLKLKNGCAWQYIMS